MNTPPRRGGKECGVARAEGVCGVDDRPEVTAALGIVKECPLSFKISSSKAM